MLAKLSLRLRVFLFFAALALGALGALGAGLGLGYLRLGKPETLPAFVQGGVVAGFLIVGMVVWVWVLFDANVARPIDILSGALRARTHSDVSSDMDQAIARYLGDLAPAATAAARRLAETRQSLAEAVARETRHLSAEMARLEALLSDVPVGVLLCSGDHALAFYNTQAADLIAAGAPPGLDRSLFDYLHAGPIRHAHDRLIANGDSDAATDLLCTTIQGARVLSARMRLTPGAEGAPPGYVLTLRDVTADLSDHARHEALITEGFDPVRRAAANLCALLEAIPEGKAGPGPMDAALRQEAGALALAVTGLSRRHEEAGQNGWLPVQTRASDLADGLRARLEGPGVPITTTAAPILLRCNGFEIISVLDDIALHLRETADARDLSLTIDEEHAGAMIRLSWQGSPVAIGDLDRWLTAPLDKAVPEITCKSVLARHGTELWPEPLPDGRQSLCLPIRQARRVTARPRPVVRTVVYDFDLLSRDRSRQLVETPLEALTYVVFDTETTGLLPQQGDEIVQIAAIRIVNGRRVDGEVFDTLVNPHRPIPPASTEVHGITEAMVAEAPDLDAVLRRFHKFAEGAVLVAHNAPFDMQFLRRREGQLGLAFDHPVLDTVLLSAVVYGQHEVHSLDALTHRLGITIPEADRHTAIGDAVATAEALLKLLPVLQGRGLARFGDVLTEVRKHGRLLKDLN